MDSLEKRMKTEDRIRKSIVLLKIHEKNYLGRVDRDLLLDDLMSLTHGLEFLLKIQEYSQNKDLVERIYNLGAYVKKKLQSLQYHVTDEGLVMKLAHAYAGLREELKNVIIKPGTKEYDVVFPEIFTSVYSFSGTTGFLCEKIKEILFLDCKADQITPMSKELEGIYEMLYFLQPMFGHANPWLTEKEEEKKLFVDITTFLDRATCFIYLSFVEKMDDEMVLSAKNSLSDLIIEEAQIMKMYLSLETCSFKNLDSHVNMLLRLLEWNKKCYLGGEMGASLEDHIMSIEHGLQLIVTISEYSNYSRNISVERFRHLVSIMKRKLYSLPNNQKDENLTVNSEQEYGELRDELCNFAINPGTNNLFSDKLEEGYHFWATIHFNNIRYLLVQKIRLLVTSSCKADKIAPMMRELEELKNKLISLEPLFHYVKDISKHPPNVKEEKVLAALTTFLARATCLIYLSFVLQLNEDVLVPLKKMFALLIEETEIKEMSLILGIIFLDDLEADLVRYLSLLKRKEECHMGTINEAILKDNIMSLKHGIEFLKWLPRFYINIDLERRMFQLAGNVKQKLELLTCKHGDESLNMNVNGAYADFREEMMNLIINQATNKYDILFPDLKMKYHFGGDNDFLVEKIETLVTSNCKADQIAPLKKELQDLRKMLTSLKPLVRYVDYVNRKKRHWDCEKEFLTNFLTFHHKATFLIYLSFVGKMDKEMMLSVKCDISTTIKETDVLETYTVILNKIRHDNYNLQMGFLFDRNYIDKELPVLQNLILLLRSNVESLDDANSNLYEVLIDVHEFLLALSSNVILRKLHFMKESFELILLHAIPIIYSCYLEPTEVDISAEFNCVLDLICLIKSEVVEMKLYYFPRVDDLGFLEFLLGYLEDLMKNQEILIHGIVALHFEVDTLLSLAKSRNQEELDKNPWNDMMSLAYQAEYIIDLYLVSSPRDLGLISSLSKIIEQLHTIIADVTWDPAQDVAAETSEPQIVGLITQVRDNDGIVGLQEETKNIMDDLLNGEKKLYVVAIIGMAGVGKTTLASTLYNTPSTVHHFDIRAWCAVSQSYQLRALLVSLLDQVNASDKVSNMDDQDLADHFCRSLKKRRYLIVLDDIWDTMLWNHLKSSLPDNGNGSRILITTRNRDVADQIGSKVNELDGLSEENSWELFQTKMLEKERLSNNLLKISKLIVEKCKGLPLSIVIIAGILSGVDRTEKKWNQIAKSVSSPILSDPQGKCKAILELSYNHLPNHLRSCFLYLGSFEEDQEISVNRLINLWIAEGFVQDTKSNSAEEVARKYVEDLIAKNLVIPAKERSRGGVKTFHLHDLLRDFCLDQAKEKHFLTVLNERNDSQPLQDPRRLIINWPLKNDLLFSCHSLRSMICNSDTKASEIEMRIRSCDMVLLKVLEVDKVKARFFPLISSLVHLRYLALGLQNWKFPVLPSSINKLHNLEILIIRSEFYRRIEVPDFIWDIVKLRHVHIRSKASFQVDSKRLKNSSFLLENLRSLSVAYVSFSDSKWLRKLSGLQRLSCVFAEKDTKLDDDDGNDDDVTEADDDYDDDDNDDAEADDDVEDNQLQKLIFNDNLTSLKMKHEGSSKWRFVSSLQMPISLRELTLSCFYLTSNDISKIGRAVPHLEVFKIYSCYVPFGHHWNADDDNFPELKVLKLSSLNISKWITSEESFPSLEQLWVEKCDFLDELPLDFGSLPKLRLISLRRCAPSINDSARKIVKSQREQNNSEMRLRIYLRKW